MKVAVHHVQHVLITGGAGFIGSCIVEELLRSGNAAVVLDNLSEGHREACPRSVPVYEGDIADHELLSRIFNEHNVHAVIHCAGLALVGESVKYPERYHQVNVEKTQVLLNSMREAAVDRIVFSSSCTVFGEPQYLPIDEVHPKHPINPYGRTKLFVEQELEERGRNYGLRSCSLRYFNAAGATAHNGEDRKLETHLIPLAFEVVHGKRRELEVLGTDHATLDGTCVRDYIHVQDLARAHVLALTYLETERCSSFNLGNGVGYSVKDVIAVVEKVTGCPVPLRSGPRRPGDASQLIASGERARHVLGWSPEHMTLEKIVQSAWDWQQRHPKGYVA